MDATDVGRILLAAAVVVVAALYIIAAALPKDGRYQPANGGPGWYCAEGPARPCTWVGGK